MKNVFMSCFVLIHVIAVGQSVKVTSETMNVGSESAIGYVVALDGTAQQVESQLSKFLKSVGKAKKTTDAYSISLPLINGKNYTSPLLYAVKDKGNGAAWVGIKKSDWPADTDEVMKDIEKLVYDFGVHFYRNKIQLQIDESNQALQAVEKQQQKLLNQNKDLGTRLENNKLQKVQIEKALENNKLEFESLNKKIDQNKKAQDSVAVAAEQVKKVIEMHKERQRKVN